MIETKYRVGDEVWTNLEEIGPTEVMITGIWKNDDGVFYAIESYPALADDTCYTFRFHDENLFPTKQALIESINK